MSLTSSKPTLSLFPSLLTHHIQSRNPSSPLLLFRRILQSNLKPNDLTFSSLLKSCVSSSWTSNPLTAKLEAYIIQTHLLKTGLDQFSYVTTSLLDLWMKLGQIKHAQDLFDDMLDRDIVSWNVLICGYSRNGYDLSALECVVHMIRIGVLPNQTTLAGLVPSCGRGELVVQGRSVHGFGIKGGLDLDSKVKNALMFMYSKCGDLEAAEFLFREMVERSVISWNTMIGAYGQNGFLDEAILAFKEMIEEGVRVTSVTIVTLLSANANPEYIHCYAIKTGLGCDGSVVTSLVCSYAKCGSTRLAELLYWSFPKKNLVSLTAIISSYAETGSMGMVITCFSHLQQIGMKLDSVAMVSILHGIADPVHSETGLAFHGYTIKTGLDIHTLVGNGLISMYAKFNDVEAMTSLFSEMDEKPLISWNSVISGCVQAGRASVAMEIFCGMKMSGQSPDAITVATLLSGCGQLGYLQLGVRLHNYVLRKGLEMEDFVGTSLVDMYTKCGSIERAERVFKSIKEPCLATWNTIISGYSWYGLEQIALHSYSEMREQGLKPDNITFLGVLAACVHGGLVDEGRRYFKIMTEEFGISPTLQHCACMVGLLGRAGFFMEAILFIYKMETKPDSAVWGALLSACCIHQEVKLGEYVAEKLYFLDYKNGGLYVLMSNLYAVTGRWDDGERVREMMRGTGGDGCVGVSQIEV